MTTTSSTGHLRVCHRHGREQGQEGDLMVFAETDADLLRDVVGKLEFEMQLSRRDRSGGGTSGRLVLFNHHRDGKDK